MINSNLATQALRNSVVLTTMHSKTKSIANLSTRRFNQGEKEMTSDDTFPTKPVFFSLLALTIVIIIIAASLYFLTKKSSKETKLSSSPTLTNTQRCFAITISGCS